MSRAFFTFLLLCWASIASAQEGDALKFPSPDGRFALRITEPKTEENAEAQLDLIEKASGKIIADLGTAYPSHVPHAVLVWSADSKRFAFGARSYKEGDTTVYFWNGSQFEVISLPDDLPSPDIRFRKGADGAVKNYGGAVMPLRWLKSGDLELSSDSTMLSRVDDRSYTGVVKITIAFDAQHHARVRKAGKTVTKVDE